MSSDTIQSLLSIAREYDLTQPGSGRGFLVEIRNEAIGHFSSGKVSVPVQWSYAGQTGSIKVVITPDEMLNLVVTALGRYDAGDAGDGSDAVAVTFPTFCPQH